MILDKLLEFDPSNTAITTTRDSTNVIDLVNARDLGVGYPLTFSVYTGPADFAGGTSVVISLQASADNSTYYVVEQTGTLLTATLTASKLIWRGPINHRPPQMQSIMPRYYKLVYTVVGTYTTGGVGAWINLDGQANHAYPPGIAISN